MRRRNHPGEVRHEAWLLTASTGSSIARAGTPVQGRFAPAAPVASGILEPVSPPARKEQYGRDGGTGASTEQRNIDEGWVRKPLSDLASGSNCPRSAWNGRREGCWNKTGKAVN